MHEKRNAGATRTSRAVPPMASPEKPAARERTRRAAGLVVHDPMPAEPRNRRHRAKGATTKPVALARDPLDGAVAALAQDAGAAARELESAAALQRARRELRTRDGERRQLQGELERVSAEAAAAVAQCAELRRIQEGWRAATATRDRRVAELERERLDASRLEADARKELETLRALLAGAEAGRIEAEQARAALETEARSLRETTASLRSTLGMREDALTAARSAERVAHGEEIANARRSALAANRRAEEAEERCSAREAELVRLRTSFTSLRDAGVARDAELEELHRLLETERSVIASRDEELERVRTALSAANETLVARESAERRLEGDLRSARRSLEARETELEALRASMTHAQQLLQWPGGAAAAPSRTARATAPEPMRNAPESLVEADSRDPEGSGATDLAAVLDAEAVVVESGTTSPSPVADSARAGSRQETTGDTDRADLGAAASDPDLATETPFIADERAISDSTSAAGHSAQEAEPAAELQAEPPVPITEPLANAPVFEHEVRRTRLGDADLAPTIDASGEPAAPAVPEETIDGPVELRRASSLWTRLAERVTRRERRAPATIVPPLRRLATSAASAADLPLALSPAAPVTPPLEYWVAKYVRPKLEACGIESLDAFFLDPLVARCRALPRETVSILSLSAGTGELEVRLASMARAEGISNFRIDCMASDPASLIAGRELASERHVGSQIRFLHRTIAQWTGEESYALCLAVDSLHRVALLEATLDRVHRALGSDGVLLTVERIGANGHARWPEARAILERIWRLMPARYKTLASSGAVEPDFDAPPASADDGLRAADLLSELVARFESDTFVAFGNLIEPFLHPRFTGAIDPSNEEDRRFLDRVAEIDDAKIDAGVFPPTRIVASWQTGAVARMRSWRDRTPETCVRRAVRGSE